MRIYLVDWGLLQERTPRILWRLYRALGAFAGHLSAFTGLFGAFIGLFHACTGLCPAGIVLFCNTGLDQGINRRHSTSCLRVYWALRVLIRHFCAILGLFYAHTGLYSTWIGLLCACIRLVGAFIGLFLSIYRALFRMYWALLRIHKALRAPWRIYRALLSIYRALFRMYWALLRYLVDLGHHQAAATCRWALRDLVVYPDLKRVYIHFYLSALAPHRRCVKRDLDIWKETCMYIYTSICFVSG